MVVDDLSERSSSILIGKNKLGKRGLTSFIGVLVLLGTSSMVYEILTLNTQNQGKQEEQVKVPDHSAHIESSPSQIGSVNNNVTPLGMAKTKIQLSTYPTNPNTGQPTQLQIRIIDNQLNSIAKHVDYKVTIMKGNNQIFGTRLLHTVDGLVTIPYKFQETGTYRVKAEVDGIMMTPISDTAEFAINVGSS